MCSSDLDDLVVTVRSTGETITVKCWYAGDSNRLYAFEFSDGTVWDQEEIELRRDREIVGTDGDDVLTGSSGDDVLVGRRGNDTLRGEFGDDVYVWNPGDGNDVVRDPYGDNTLRFGAGVAPENVRVTSDGKDLFLTIGEGGERITVSDWFADGRSLSSVRFSDVYLYAKSE